MLAILLALVGIACFAFGVVVITASICAEQ